MFSELLFVDCTTFKSLCRDNTLFLIPLLLTFFLIKQFLFSYLRCTYSLLSSFDNFPVLATEVSLTVFFLFFIYFLSLSVLFPSFFAVMA